MTDSQAATATRKPGMLGEIIEFLGHSLDRMRENPKATLQVLAIIVLFLVIFKPVGPWMISRFELPESNYSHGYMIPLVVAFMLFIRREAIASAERAPCGPARKAGAAVAAVGLIAGVVLWTVGRNALPSDMRVPVVLLPPPLVVIGLGAILYTLGWGTALLTGGLLMHLFGMVTGLHFISAYAILPVVLGLVLHFFGPAVVRQMYYPILYTAFMLPLPRELLLKVTFHMKTVAAHAATFVVRRIGVAAVLRGNSEIWLPNRSHPVEVGYPCSGMRSLVALLALSFFFVYIVEAPRWKKVTLVLSSFPVSWAANITRISLLTLFAYWYGIETIAPGKPAHDVTGFALWLVALLGFAGVWGLVNWRSQDTRGKPDEKA